MTFERVRPLCGNLKQKLKADSSIEESAFDYTSNSETIRAHVESALRFCLIQLRALVSLGYISQASAVRQRAPFRRYALCLSELSERPPLLSHLAPGAKHARVISHLCCTAKVAVSQICLIPVAAGEHSLLLSISREMVSVFA